MTERDFMKQRISDLLRRSGTEDAEKLVRWFETNMPSTEWLDVWAVAFALSNKHEDGGYVQIRTKGTKVRLAAGRVTPTLHGASFATSVVSGDDL